MTNGQDDERLTFAYQATNGPPHLVAQGQSPEAALAFLQRLAQRLYGEVLLGTASEARLLELLARACRPDGLRLPGAPGRE